MKTALPLLLSIIFLAALAACLPISTPRPPLASSTPLPPTITSTATTVWFPPTPTYTPLPTTTISITPTLDTSPKYGNLILADDFNEPGLWSTGKVPAGSIAIGANELTLAVSGEKGYLFSLRQGTRLDNFYAELTASPSICRSEDEYGLLLRVSPSLDFLRFSFSCDGHARVDRYFNGQASSPQPPIMSGSVPPGAPSSSRMSVLAKGKELQFYANGKFLFSVKDPNLLIGGLGVFVRAAGQEPVTVNFSDLAVYETSP